MADTAPDLPASTQAPVALMFDYTSIWACQIQPHTEDFDALELHLLWYSALRRLGLDVDIVSSRDDLKGYSLIVLPCQVIANDALAKQLEAARESGSRIIIGARSGSRTVDFRIPEQLAPGALAGLSGVTVDRVDGLRPGAEPALTLANGHKGRALRWRDLLDLERQQAKTISVFDDGEPAVTEHHAVTYLTGWLNEDSMVALFEGECRKVGIAVNAMPSGVRLRRRGPICFAFNYAPEARRLPESLVPSDGYLVGTAQLPPAGVSIWRDE